MQPKLERALLDIIDAAQFVLSVTAPLTLEKYVADQLLQFAVERNFEIIGEAMNRVHGLDASTASRITASEQIIAFRNLLIHGYDVIDDEHVWQIIQQDLPTLLKEVQQLISS